MSSDAVLSPAARAAAGILSPALILAGAVAALAVPLYAAIGIGFEIALLAGLSLVGLAWLFLALWLALLAAGAVLALRRHGAPSWPVPDATAGGLALLILAGVILAIVPLYPNPDEGYYLANVSYATAHPGAPITSEIRGIDATPLAPFVSGHWSTAVSYEFLPAVIARWTGIHHLDLRYLWLPGLAGALLVASVFVLMRMILASERKALPVTEREALFATLAVVLLYVIWREAHRDPGNFAFPRLYQGKAVVMTALLPLYAALTLRFLRAPGWLCGAALAVTALGGGALSASALFLLGGTGMGVTAGAIAEAPRAAARRLGRAVMAALLCLPMVLMLTRAFVEPLDLGMQSMANDGWPKTFWGHARFLGLSSWALLAVLLAVVGVLVRGKARALALAWTASVIVVLANPLTGQWLIEHLLGPNVYWRIFYVLPWVPLAGLAALAVTDRLPPALARRRGPAAAGLLLIAAPAMWALDGLRGGHAPVWPPSWKLDPEIRAEAAAIIAATPEGPMLAPLELTPTLLVLDGNRPQARIRTVGLRVWSDAAGEPALADRRILATTLLAGADRPGRVIREDGYFEASGLPDDAAAQAAALEAVLAESRPVSVIVRRDAPDPARIAVPLEAAGFTRDAATGRYDIWLRPGGEAGAGPGSQGGGSGSGGDDSASGSSGGGDDSGDGT